MPLEINQGQSNADVLTKLYKTNFNIRQELDNIVRDAGFGSLSTINYLTLRGFNYLRQGQQLVHNNRDNMGYVFFTRPILNLTYDNLSSSDHMTRLRNAPAKSIPRYVKMMLDPWQHRNVWQDGKVINDGNTNSPKNAYENAKRIDNECPLCDPNNPFITLLSNTLTSLTGWKDITMNEYTSPKGVHNEQWVMADGFYYITDSFELSSNFKNIEGDPVSLLFETWIHYIAACRQEYEMNPYPCFVEEREFDYFTRIYRFVMDHSKTYIQKWAATIAFPTTNSIGNAFNYSTDKNFIDGLNEIAITWKCVGADYNRPILFDEFNRLVGEYCPALRVVGVDPNNYQDCKIAKPELYRKLRPHEKNRGLFMAIPLINQVTSELEWWISNEDYNRYVLPYAKRKYDNTVENNDIVNGNRGSSRINRQGHTEAGKASTMVPFGTQNQLNQIA